MSFVKSTWDFKQPNTKALGQFVGQMIDAAVKTSDNVIIKGAYVAPYYLYPSESMLAENKIKTNCIITYAHDEATQELYPDTSRTMGKTVDIWHVPYVINARIENILPKEINTNPAEIIIDIKDELIDLLCFNDGEYTNTDSATETFKNRPLHNNLLESVIVHEGTQTPSHYTASLTILFTIYK